MRSILLALLISLLIMGCNPQITGDTIQEEQIDIYEQMMRNSNRVESFSYNSSETGNKLLYYNRYVKAYLNEPRVKDGEKYDIVYMDRINKVALGRCSTELCGEKDLEFVEVEYSEFYELDPIEWTYRYTAPVYVGEEMFGQHIAEVFNITSLTGDEGRVWIQQYYGIPLKIEFDEKTIDFINLRINTVMIGHVQLPIAFNVSGEQYEFGWYGYLNEEFGEEFN